MGLSVLPSFEDMRLSILRIPSWRPKFLDRISRSQYKQAWNRVSTSENEAKVAVSGTVDEKLNRDSAGYHVGILEKYVQVRKNDVILEIGAGFGRLGAALAPLCREWIGTDVSDNMVRHMRRRLAGHPNTRMVVTNGFDLASIPTASVDLVYSVVVFMHLEEWERYGYVLEGFRILKPGGRMLIDSVNLLSDLGWKIFEEHRAVPPSKRPPNMSKPSTPQEQEIYFRRAGFTDIKQEQIGSWIITYGIKR